ncbi:MULTISPECIES: hypothetical protein [Thermoactinomyces]|jgi:hypothetical protein|uniref:Uncharacterized protein n=1 Tax=Thermoactinomyces daqus TaxID=1329516 RepID=A0A7W1X9X8_9BACL|nr:MULTISPECIES: hypothetical protein [Thermoactinomyces]MBA4542663.1 hypothetical protein [Thermoactinomyces daqus]MBH8597356.1 hypothetical protein [Thermoactinomyces sp. CICC 10523]MBH8607235.1 hypothetical protein [Thermoactinomyces sp. CICC 10521]
MDENRLCELRKKQSIYSNLFYLCIIALLFVFLLVEPAARLVYFIWGCLFVLFPLISWWMKSPNPFLHLFPEMRELYQYERDKLGEKWGAYYTSTSLLLFVVGIFFFVQAWIREGNIRFGEGISWWYFVIVLLFLILLGNVHLRSQARRIDSKTPEELKDYASDKMLFSLVFASVAIGMTLIGTIVYILMGA